MGPKDGPRPGHKSRVAVTETINETENALSDRKPIGLTDEDMKFIRRMLLVAVSGDATVLSEEDAAHAARLIHRLGRLSDEQ